MRVGRLSEKPTHKIRMQTMDYTRKACVTALPNLVTESQKYEKSSNFWERTFWSVVLRRNCLRATGFFLLRF